jgi:signal transduction histidine kinase
VTITARREGAWLHLSVHDDGVGLGDGGAGEVRGAGGLGIATTRARLRGLYGASHEVTLRPSAEGGVATSLTFPFHRVGDVNDG